MVRLASARWPAVLFSVAVALMVVGRASLEARAAPTPPVAPKEPRARTLHGETIIDDYAWLRDKTRPTTLAHLRAENAYTAAMMRPTRALQKQLYAEILSRTREDDTSPPYRRRGFQYTVREQKGKEHTLYARRALDAAGQATGPEQVILDVNQLAKPGHFVAVNAIAISSDGMLMAYGVDLVGHEDYTLRIRDLRSGRELPDRLARVGSFAWAADGHTLLYTVEDAAKRAHRVYRHRLGEPSDALVYDEEDARFNVEVLRTTDDALILITSSSHTQSEIRFLRADAPAATPTLVSAREPELEYDVDHGWLHGQETLFIRTNRGGRNFRLVTTPIERPGITGWRELLPHDGRIMREEFQVFSRFLVVEEREAGVRQLRVLDLESGAQHRVELDEPVHEVALSLNYVFDSPTFRFVYHSPLTPPTYYDYDPMTRQRTLVKRETVPGGYDPGRYQVERVEVPSGGVRVPVTLISARGLARDGSAPLLLEAYGAYGSVVDLEFDEARFSMLDRGVLIALAHVRGGGELGKPWHDDGRMMNKLHTFEDLLAVADWLVAERYADPMRLSLVGGSAGGLLVGAVLNLRPERFRAAIAQVPFVDVVNTMLDETIPLTVGEFEEWGNPKLEAEYRYLRRYSPYENLRAAAYPALLVTTALNDARAPFWEAAKWVARLRTTKTDARPVLLRVDLTENGHGGPSGRYQQISERAYEFAFLLDQLGVPPARPRTAVPPSGGAHRVPPSGAAAPASR